MPLPQVTFHNQKQDRPTPQAISASRLAQFLNVCSGNLQVFLFQPFFIFSFIKYFQSESFPQVFQMSNFTLTAV